VEHIAVIQEYHILSRKKIIFFANGKINCLISFAHNLAFVWNINRPLVVVIYFQRGLPIWGILFNRILFLEIILFFFFLYVSIVFFNEKMSILFLSKVNEY